MSHRIYAHERFVNFYLPANKKFSIKTVKPFRGAKRAWDFSKEEAEKLEIVGIWLFADSDNSSSTSKAVIKDIKFLVDQKRSEATLPRVASPRIAVRDFELETLHR